MRRAGLLLWSCTSLVLYSSERGAITCPATYINIQASKTTDQFSAFADLALALIPEKGRLLQGNECATLLFTDKDCFFAISLFPRAGLEVFDAEGCRSRTKQLANRKMS